METSKLYIEAWFDYHPDPAAVELFEFFFDEYKISVFAAENIHDNYMIKVKCPSATDALDKWAMLHVLATIMGIELIRINETLFLFTDRRF